MEFYDECLQNSTYGESQWDPDFKNVRMHFNPVTQVDGRKKYVDAKTHFTFLDRGNKMKNFYLLDAFSRLSEDYFKKSNTEQGDFVRDSEDELEKSISAEGKAVEFGQGLTEEIGLRDMEECARNDKEEQGHRADIRQDIKDVIIM